MTDMHMKSNLATALFLAFAAPAAAGEIVTVYRDPGCSCCDVYVDYLRENDFEVTVVDDPTFDRRSVEAGVPANALGCHLAMIDGYAISGLVPVRVIERLLDERPAVTGITLPGMPVGAPGMPGPKAAPLKVYAFSESGVSLYAEE
jgi:hypothetical protein